MSARITNAQIHAEFVELRALLLARPSAPVVAAPAAAPIAADKPKTFYTKAEIARGLGFPCALGCGRRLRTMVGASSHDIAHGHNAATK